MRTQTNGNYGIFIIMGNAGFVSSTVMNRAVGSGRAGTGAGWPCARRLAFRISAFLLGPSNSGLVGYRV